MSKIKGRISNMNNEQAVEALNNSTVEDGVYIIRRGTGPGMGLTLHVKGAPLPIQISGLLEDGFTIEIPNNLYPSGYQQPTINFKDSHHYSRMQSQNQAVRQIQGMIASRPMGGMRKMSRKRRKSNKLKRNSRNIKSQNKKRRRR